MMCMQLLGAGHLAAGAVVLELLTGEVPYGSANLAERIVTMDRGERLARSGASPRSPVTVGP